MSQIAKIKGAVVIGSAGGPDKCAYLRENGVDHVVDYKAEPDLTAALARAAPDGIEACFERRRRAPGGGAGERHLFSGDKLGKMLVKLA